MIGLILAGALTHTSARAADPQSLRVSTWSGAHEAGDGDYFYDLVKQVLAETEGEYGPAIMRHVSEKISQGRLLAELRAGRLDLVWTATNTDRERNIHPIRIPVDMGLIGQRVPVIRAERAAEFARIRSVDDLRRFTACQGAQWPDAAILRASGLPQVDGPHADQMYAMLRAGRCDYFARGLAEVAGEFAAFGSADLVVFERLVIAYPMPVYLFVAEENAILARRLEQGLQAMVARGAVRDLMMAHPSTRAAFPLERFKDAVILRLPNPNLPAATPLDNPALWLDVGDPRLAAAGPS